MPGRNFSTPSYHYGFNGKEKVDEILNVGGSDYDYGYRMYDARLGRFLSVDPLAWKFPELTPYQFASNRPIDGIDLDGLEYATYNIVVSNKGVVMDISVKKDYELKNAGTKGPGIQYNYIHLDEVGNVKVKQPKPEFVKNRYGIYGGENNPKLPDEGGNYKDTKDNFDLAPIDEYDLKYQGHDRDYAAVDANGPDDAKNNPKTIPADKTLLKGLDEISANKAAKGKDAVTGKEYGGGSFFASKAKLFFNYVINRKEKIAAKNNSEKK